MDPPDSTARPSPKDSKVFCIGFQKTGTSSLHVALERLGYDVCGTRSDLVEEIRDGNMDPVWKTVEEFDAFEDHPWPQLFRELDERCPGSRFILTVRDEDAWLKSCVRFFGSEPHPVSEWVYGVPYPVGNEERYREVYRRHNAAVRDHFADRPRDLLVMELAAGDGWAELCPFLDAPLVEEPFVHINRADDPGNWYKRSRTVAWILERAPWLRTLKRAIFD